MSFLLSKTLIDRICHNILNHNSIQTSFRMEGITDVEFSLAMETAETNPYSEAAAFKARIEQSEAIAEAEGVEAVNALALTGHAGAIMWRQERRYGSSWGKGDGKAKEMNAASSAAPQIMLPTNGRETNNQ